jgi:hypothetical protein
MNRRNHSDIHYGIPVRDRPGDIPVLHDSRWCLLTSYAAERLLVARHTLADGEHPQVTRYRLCRFWSDLSIHIRAEGIDPIVLDALATLADYEYKAAGYWLDGLWHHNGTVMARLLWHFQCPNHVVSAALDLHRRVSARSTADEDASRFTPGRFLSLIFSL